MSDQQLPKTRRVKETQSSTEKQSNKKSWKREVAELLFIALILVPTINIFILQSYAIPTSSMESEMLVGDKLFVSKLNYGPRVPMTPLGLPYVHNTIFGANSYTEAVSLPYKRLPGFSSVKANDIVVFNCPHFKPDMDANRPVDKRTNYVKRCVAVGGDSLQVINGVVHINGQKRDDLRNLQHAHLVECSTSKFSRKKLREFGVSEFYDRGPIRIKEEYINIPPNAYMMFITDAMADKFRKMSNVSKVEKIVSPEGSFNPRIYPMTDKFPWNPDFYGPIYLPKVGDNIAIDSLTYPMYEWAIKKYENNPDLTWNEAEQKAYMNGKVLDSYTFKMNYYFMMGDNRDNSEDSRFWGFVPEDHIVGKPVFVWLSTDKNADSWFSWVRWGKSFRIPR